MRYRYTAACALAAMLGSVGLPAGSARADTVTPLPPLSYLHQILVDDPAGYVFLSEGFYSDHLQTTGGGIVVTNLAGKHLTTLDTGRAAEGIAIRGGTLYAALDADHAVAAIDIATIRQPTPTQTLYPLGNNNDLPYDLALQSGKLWVSYDEGSATGAVGEIDLTAAHPVFTPAVLTGPSWNGAPELAADPKNHGFLVAADPNELPTPMATYDVASGSTAPLAQTAPFHIDDCPSSELGVAVAAGGGTFLVVCDGYSGVLAFNTFTLAPAGSYGAFPGGPLAGAVAVAPDGAIAVSAAGGASPLASYISTFTTGGTALNTYQYSFAQTVMTHGLAWSADGTRLYAVLVTYINNNPATASYSLRVIDNAVAPTLSLTGTSRATYGRPVALSGTVTTGTVAPPAGARVTITRKASGGSPTTRFTTSTSADGGFTFTDRTHPLPGRYSYTASYNGMSTRAATHTVTISPARAAVAMALHGFYATFRHGSTVYRLYHHTARVSATVTVRPARPGECVRLELQEHYRGRWQARPGTPCSALSRTSKVTASFAASTEALGYPYRVRAVFVPGRDTTVSGAESGWQYLMIEN